jgi:hypothetical protein
VRGSTDGALVGDVVPTAELPPCRQVGALPLVAVVLDEEIGALLVHQLPVHGGADDGGALGQVRDDLEDKPIRPTPHPAALSTPAGPDNGHSLTISRHLLVHWRFPMALFMHGVSISCVSTGTPFGCSFDPFLNCPLKNTPHVHGTGLLSAIVPLKGSPALASAHRVRTDVTSNILKTPQKN